MKASESRRIGGSRELMEPIMFKGLAWRLFVSIRAVCLVSFAAVAPAAGSAQDTFPPVDRIVAVGDVHGDYNQFVTVLRQAGVIDDANRWIGGKAHLVQTGDVPDRGADTRKALDLLMALEEQALKAGGQVHALIGNHEAMNIQGDLRYVVPGEYDAFRTDKSEVLRDRVYKALADSARRDDPAYRKEWEADHPLGWVEHRLAYEGKGSYGDWIRRHNAVVKIGDYVFLHGGIGPKYVDQSITQINDAVRRDLSRPATDTTAGVAGDPEGPLWFRGLATDDEALLDSHVDQVLKNLGVKHIVIGHTVTPGTVITRHDGKVIMIDVGMSAAFGGPPAALVIEGGKPYTVHRGKKLELPLQGDPVPYLKAAAALDPAPSRLTKYLETLEGAAVPR